MSGDEENGRASSRVDDAPESWRECCEGSLTAFAFAVGEESRRGVSVVAADGIAAPSGVASPLANPCKTEVGREACFDVGAGASDSGAVVGVVVLLFVRGVSLPDSAMLIEGVCADGVFDSEANVGCVVSLFVRELGLPDTAGLLVGACVRL